MSVIGDDRFSRTGAAPSAAAFSLRLPVLIFVSLALIALSRLDHPWVRDLRRNAEATIAPVLSAAMLPVEPARRLVRQLKDGYDGAAEIERLRSENRLLRQWQARASELDRKLAEMSEIARAVPQQGIEYRTARVIAMSSGPFVQSALLEAGTEHGIRAGQPVLNAGGLLGRIVEAGRRTSRLLLLTDVNSRVPVLIGSAQHRAILAGDNSGEPRLLMLPQGASLDSGEEITTSGLGGMFPRGLRVGVTTAGARGIVARLDAGLGDLEYVGVLLFDSPGLALSRELRPLSGEAQTRARAGGERSVRP